MENIDKTPKIRYGKYHFMGPLKYHLLTKIVIHIINVWGNSEHFDRIQYVG